MCMPKQPDPPINKPKAALGETEKLVTLTTSTAEQTQQDVLGAGVPKRIEAPSDASGLNIRM